MMATMSGHAAVPGGAALHAAKVELRRKIREMRDRMTPVTRQSAAEAAIARVLGTPQWRQATAVLLTLSFGSELSTDALADAALAAGKRLILPRVDATAKMLELFFVEDIGRQVAAGALGIREPILESCRPAAPECVDCAVVPGLAFDREGGRLGYGGGYFDRLLPQLRDEVPRIAVAYSLQLVDQVPRAPHDRGVNLIVTDAATIRVGRN